MITKPKGLRKLFSYLYEYDIRHFKGEYNNDLTLSFYKNRWKLSTKNAVYSFEDLYTVYLAAFELLGFKTKKINNTLCLGFGLGSIPIILNQKYNVQNFIGIENDIEIIKLFNELYTERDLGKLKLIHSDAHSFVEKYDNENFDLITLDIFVDTKIPSQFEDIAFIKKLRSMLSADGILLFNRLTTPKEKSKTISYYKNIFRKVFTDSKALVINQNLMLCGFN